MTKNTDTFVSTVMKSQSDPAVRYTWAERESDKSQDNIAGPKHFSRKNIAHRELPSNEPGIF